MNTSRSVHSKEGYRRFYWTHFASVESKELPSNNSEKPPEAASSLKLDVVRIPLQGQPDNSFGRIEEKRQ
jgi:hypothetical protein